LLRMLAATFLDPIETTDAGPVAVRETAPVAAGGLGATNLGHNLDAFRRDDLGYAVAPLAGSNILDHPHGPRAGAIAMWQAARAYQEASITDPAALRDWARASGGAELMALFG
jgi:ribulose 1,5-bisphosphate carboxylase large subunit-like protein